jgi:hypothetical protein
MHKYFENSEGKRVNRIPRRRWEDNTRRDTKYTVYDIMAFILLVHDSLYWRAVLIKVMNLRIP